MEQEFTRRQQRHGAFRADRSPTTAVDTGGPLTRRLVDLAPNMARVLVVGHARAWEEPGSREIEPARRRYRIIDRGARGC